LSLGGDNEHREPPVTRVLRLEPADVDLAALVALDSIAERVVSGQLSLPDAWLAMRALDREDGMSRRFAEILAFGLAAGAVAALLRTGWSDVGVAAALGLIVGIIATLGHRGRHFAPAVEAIAAFVVTFLAIVCAHLSLVVSVQAVVVASLIVLMPGLTLTTAVSELATQQLVTGTTRFAGAVMTLLKLTFGSVAAAQLAGALVGSPAAASPAALSMAVEGLAAFVAAFAIAVLFRAPTRDIALVMGSAILGYVMTRAGAELFGFGSGTAFAGAVFFSSTVIAALSNVYGRLVNRPAALVRVSGIMLLVPGSAGFRGITSVMERNYEPGFETAVAVVSALVALAAGLLFGSLIVPPRRHL
jgi:uncharacterized membrane protein YjjB (DUF3815 family)